MHSQIFTLVRAPVTRLDMDVTAIKVATEEPKYMSTASFKANCCV
jgi:hypothetical protein